MGSLDMSSLYSIRAIAILDQDGNRLLAKYYDKEIFPTPKEQAAFEKNLFQRTNKANAEIVLFDGLVCVYRSNVDLFFYVIGSAQENELLLVGVLNCLYDSFSTVLKKNVEKKALLDNIDIAFLILDEICDDGIILETDFNAIINRCCVRPDDLNFSDQSILQLLGSAKDQFKWSLLKMLRNNSSTPRKSLGSAKTKRAYSASPARRGALFSPPKLSKPSDDQKSPFQTPTKLFAMDNLDAALNHYFSPKKKFIKSPNRTNTKRQINFDTDDELTEDENDENVVPSVQPLKEVKCDLEELARCFTIIDNFLPNDLFKLESEYEEQFLYWKDMLLTKKFSVLLHGLGTKRRLLNNFVKHSLSNFNYINIECFKAGVNCRHIFEALNDEFCLKIVHRGLSLADWAMKLQKCIKDKLNSIFIVLHNIDAQGLREPAQQEALSILAESSAIYMIATIDHNNATLLWNQKTRDRFNWLFVPVPTFCSYGETLLNCELKSLGLNVKQGGRAHTFASLDVFWQATTQNMRKILQQLAIHAGVVSTKEDQEALALSKFCKILKKEFATTSEAVLRQQLGEFIDSSIIQMDKDGSILLAVDRNLLVAFLESKNFS